jgi:ribonuclease HII
MHNNNHWLNLIKNYKIIAGVDEVGRGSLVGEVVAACIIIPEEKILKIKGIKDSKLLTEKNRNLLSKKLLQASLDYAFGVVGLEEISRKNILNASLFAMKKAVINLKNKPEFLLIDGNKKIDIDIPQLTIIKGDRKCPLISCASIIAKVYRDRMMYEYHLKYPHYRLDKNKGYCTKEHVELLKKHGVSDIHRITFKPIVDMLNKK